MNINDIKVKIDDLRAKMADANGDDKAKYQAEIDKLEDEIKSGGQNIAQSAEDIFKH